MSKCTECSNDIYDFEELKYGLCWDCMSNNESIIDENPDIGEIKDNEIEDGVGNDKYSVSIRNNDGSRLTLCTEELDKGKMSDDKAESSKPKKTTTVKKKTGKSVSQDDIDPENGDEPPVVDGENNEKGSKEPKTTTEPKPNVAPKKSDNDEGEQQLIRESKEIITKSSRAKTRAFALINQALKETGLFEVTATADGKRMTVGSAPFKDRNIEDVIMSTTMEVLDTDVASGTKNKKK